MVPGALRPGEGIAMAAKKAAKRLGKKHRQAATRPHKASVSLC
jgi:hypothetical protein